MPKYLHKAQVKALQKNRAQKDLKDSGMGGKHSGSPGVNLSAYVHLSSGLKECTSCDNVVWLDPKDKFHKEMICQACGEISCLACNTVGTIVFLPLHKPGRLTFYRLL